MSKKDKINSINRPWIITLILSSVIPMLIMIITYAMKSIYPGGKFTILVADQYKQYLPLFASLRYLFKGDSNIFYSYFGALGSSNLGTVAYYLSNPISWISVLVPLKNLPDYFYYVTIIRFGLIGLSFCFYLYKAFPDKRNPIFALAGSCCYALMSYNIVYSFNLMWLDIVILLPWLLLGVEYILSEKKPYVFMFSLALCLIFNFYLTYMAGVFSFIYILYRLFYDNKKNKIKILLVYARSGFISFAVVMPILFPAVYSVFIGKGKEADDVSGISLFIHNIPDVLKQLMPCQYDTYFTYGLPFIFCGSVIFLFFVLSFIAKNISVKQKILNFLVFAFYLFSFIFRPLDTFWHGFSIPVWFPARFSFTFCFFLILVSYQSLDAVFELFFKKFKIEVRGNGLCRILLIGFTGIELFLNSGYVIAMLSTQSHYRLRSEYDRYISDLDPFMDYIAEDNSFFRVSNDNSFSMFDSALLGYKGISYFSSSYNHEAMSLFGLMGYEQWNHVLRDCGGTPFSESLFGVKYKISYMDKASVYGYDKLMEYPTYLLYENPNCVPLGFEYIYSDSADLTEDIFMNQNIISRELSGSESEVFNSIKFTAEDYDNPNFKYSKIITFTPETDNPVWIYVNDAANEDIVRGIAELYAEDAEDGWNGLNKSIQSFVELSDGTRYQYLMENKNYCLCIGALQNGVSQDVIVESNIPFGNIYVYSIDDSSLKDNLDMIKSSPFIVDSSENGKITGHINVIDEGADILLTLPYMDGYVVKVDGSSSQYRSYRNALISIPVTQGEHSVEIYFIPPGFITGVGLGLICIFFAIVLLFIDKKIFNRAENETGK